MSHAGDAQSLNSYCLRFLQLVLAFNNTASLFFCMHKTFPGCSEDKESTCSTGDPGSIHLQYRRPRFNYWVRKIPWRREWPPTPVFLLGEFHGQRSLAGYSPWCHKESDTMEQLKIYPSAKVLSMWKTILCISFLIIVFITYNYLCI